MYNILLEKIMISSTQIEIPKEKIASWNIFIAIPCYGRMISSTTFISMLQASIYFHSIGLKHTICELSDSLITRARNNLAAKFLALEECTHLMFIDSDIQFDRESILKMLWHDKDVITGSYPIKEIDWEKVQKAVINKSNISDLAKLSTRHVVHIGAPNQAIAKVENGAIEVYEAGTGFMLIKRQVFEKMMKKYKKYKYQDDTGAMQGKENEYTYNFFNSFIDDDARLLSEDYGFCRLYQKVGGSIWVEPTINLNHIGTHVYQGNMINSLNEIIEKNSHDN